MRFPEISISDNVNLNEDLFFCPQDTQVRGIIIPCKASGTPDYIEHAKKMLEVFKFHLSTLESALLEPQPKRKKYR